MTILKKFLQKHFKTLYKFLKKIHKSKKSFIPPPNDGKIRYNLGCGDKILPGYINVDIVNSRRGIKPEINCDIRHLTFKKKSADEIMAIHVIEHFFYWEASDLIKHWKSFLKPGGKIILECPNIHQAAKKLAKNERYAKSSFGKEGQPVMWALYGDPAWQDPLMCHKWGYTPLTLIELLETCGFEDVREEKAIFKQKNPRDMRVVGVNKI